MTREFKILVYLSLLILGFMVASPIANKGVTYVPPITVDLKQLACMAKNIFYEAGSESVLGQAAVARVVVNRVKYGFAKTPCGVVFQTTLVDREDEEGALVQTKLCQFSWVCEGKDEPSKFNARYIQAKQIAYDVLAFDAYKEVVPKTTLFFHNLTVNPNWPYKRVAQIDNHVFYSKGRE
jgi:spore germination cell wall hydrolase CwlJ-like protein